jgi:hypothetical protein
MSVYPKNRDALEHLHESNHHGTKGAIAFFDNEAQGYGGYAGCHFKSKKKSAFAEV